MLAEEQTPKQVASALGCSLASIYNWAAAWQQEGRTGLAEARHDGRTRTLDPTALRLLEQWLETDPQTQGEQTTGWTVPLLHTRLTQAGSSLQPAHAAAHVTPPGLALETAQVCVGQARPGLRGKKGALVARVQQAQTEGKEVWVGDETTLREFPPLRSAWARRGQ